MASERLVECDLRDPRNEFLDIRSEVQQELHAIASDAERAGYNIDEVCKYVVAEEEQRADIEWARGRSSTRGH